MTPMMQPQKRTSSPSGSGETGACTACHRSMPLSSLAHLHDLELREGGSRKEVLLCDRCLQARRSRSWAANASKTDRLIKHMGGRHDRTHSRFSYLQDEAKDVHLVRLRPQWVDGHLTPPEV